MLTLYRSTTRLDENRSVWLDANGNRFVGCTVIDEHETRILARRPDLVYVAEVYEFSHRLP